jgi:Zn-dependent peptidase ImmA (M78 family)
MQIQLWKQRESILPNERNLTPEDILDPMIALRWLGYDCDYDESLGRFKAKGKSIEVAGTMDRTNKRVRISREFPVNIRNFTSAHELGHLVLGHEGIGLHRDKPLDRSGKDASRPGQEIEADKFATYFLMPEKLVKKWFKRLFRTECFALTEATMFALWGSDSMKLEARCNTRRALSRILASAERYNGVRFVSLANQFRVSNEAMAIRLEELDLVDRNN